MTNTAKTKNAVSASASIFNAAALAAFKRPHVSTMPDKDESKAMKRGELAHHAPSAFCDCPDYNKVSSKYFQIGSLDVQAELTRDDEFSPVMAFEDRKSDSEAGCRKHVIVYKRNINVADKAQRVIVTNSHDGSSYWRIRQGAENELTGMTIVTNKFARIRHYGADKSLSMVLDAVREYAEREFSLEPIKARMQAIKLTDEEAAAYAHAAALLRFGKKFQVRNPKALLTRNHKNMNGKDFWTIFSAVHENLLKGGVCVGMRALKEIYNVARWEELQENLWTMTMAALQELENMRGITQGVTAKA